MIASIHEPGNRKSGVVILCLMLGLTGCQKDSASEDSKPANLDPEATVLGSWEPDEAATKKAWGDSAEVLTRKLGDQLVTYFEIRDDNTVVLTRRKRSMEGTWKLKSKTEDTVVFEMRPRDRPEEPSTDWTFNILGKDEVSWRSNDTDPEGTVISKRKM